MLPTQSKKNVVYLTGASGFLGTMIVKLVQEDDSIDKIYCPTRGKKSKTGFQRFEEMFSVYNKAAYVDPQDELPQDTTHVILNAFNTRFTEDLGKKLYENVDPMLKILDQCTDRKGKIEGICVVSTAYCQPPAPYKADEGGRIPFLLGNAHGMKPSSLYQMLVQHYKNGNMKTHDALVDAIRPHEFYNGNEYSFSKHIMEHMVHEMYPDLPVSIVRPSMVAPTRDGQYGHESKAGVPLFYNIVQHPVFLAPRSKGKLNFVFVEDCAEDCLKGAMSQAKPATCDENSQLWHPIRMSTGKSDIAAIDMMTKTAPNIRRVANLSAAKETLTRKWETVKVRAAAGKRKSKLIKVMYDSYDPFMSHDWTFEESHETSSDEFVDSCLLFLKESNIKELERKATKKSEKRRLSFRRRSAITQEC